MNISILKLFVSLKSYLETKKIEMCMFSGNGRIAVYIFYRIENKFCSAILHYADFLPCVAVLFILAHTLFSFLTP